MEILSIIGRLIFGFVQYKKTLAIEGQQNEIKLVIKEYTKSKNDMYAR